MNPQIQITDLPTAGSVSDDDFTIVRQSSVDFKVKIGIIRDIDVSTYPVINTPAEGDLLLINRAGQNYNIRFDRVGFIAGTVMWFYQDTPPSGWTTITGIGDTLLAVKGGSNKYQSFGPKKGGWSQSNHVLSIEEIPSHTHRVLKTKDNTGSSNELGPVRGKNVSTEFFDTLATGGTGSTSALGKSGKTKGHNHGDTWRPAANVGILASKNV